jgi:two-component system NtrC family response regulator
MARILIIDDDKLVSDTLCRIVGQLGHRADAAFTLKDGLKKIEENEYEIVLLDVRLPDGNGLAHIDEINKSTYSPVVIIITAFADPDGAELAIKNNAWDYLKKPASMSSIDLSISRALQYRRGKADKQKPVLLKRDGIIGDSPKLTECLDTVARVADGEANVLIAGETGTGKELFARAIHENSQRRSSNFVIVDCTTLPETLTESILLGHAKGAFTGADNAEEGIVKQAHKGTLFLDEIGDLSINTQKVFLRILQERRYYPVGGTNEVRSDFRLISATNRDLDEMVDSNQFREDLIYRIRSVTIKLPPLRERPEDIKSLTIEYLNRMCESSDIGLKWFSPDFFQVLESYPWPGNVRELYGVLDWTMARAQDEQTLFPMHLPDEVRAHVVRSSLDDTSEEKSEIQAPDGEKRKKPAKWKDFRKSYIESGEKDYLVQLLDYTQGNVKEAAAISGISVPHLYGLLRKYQINQS